MTIKKISESSYMHVIVAGGTGKRFGAELPKQFCLLDGKPVLMHTVERIRKFGRGGKIIIVMAEEWWDYWIELCRKYEFESEILAAGGKTRWHSVKSALAFVDSQTDVITVHDAARPLLDKSMMDRLLDSLSENIDAVVPVIDLSDSIREITDISSHKSVSVPRNLYKLVQTPQVFNAKILIDAYSRPFCECFTDDASVVENIGIEVSLVEGSKRNIKITYPVDLKIAELYLAEEKNGTATAY